MPWSQLYCPKRIYSRSLFYCMVQYVKRMIGIKSLYILGSLSLVLTSLMVMYTTFPDVQLTQLFHNKRQEFQRDYSKNSNSTTCLILVWTLWCTHTYRHVGYVFGNCSESRCEMTVDKTRINDAAAVIFWGQSEEFVSGDIPAYHAPSQIWVFVTREAVLRGYFQKMNFAKTRFAINRTMTYKLDSDIPWPYGYMTSQPGQMHELKRKPRIATWLVSHCDAQSMRMSYVKDLQRYVSVDIYGRCGNHSICSRDTKKDRDGCMKYLSDSYMFYIAFENSDCKDYITEKVWTNALLHKMIPVVRGRMTNFSAHLPPGSFIHADEFATPELLGRYLMKVHSNPTLYSKYHAWRKTMSIQAAGQTFFKCALCEAIHRFRASQEKKTVDLLEFLDDRNQCFKYRSDLEEKFFKTV
ncbi:unnamed protein product [Owenia fusiformis]|uniref:Fucosyltransferase n=1 Tax=Owenia fusiformis TaxID=6347 RepID=A0A8S4NR79_OWEFU|nr:unnamed protein product [Owenia fusiformis]